MTDLFEPLPESAATRRKENTRTRLVRASLDVFVEKGIDGATVDDLVTAAGFTRGAFYSNFSTKEEVFSELFASVTEELLGIMRTAVEEAMSLHAEAGDDRVMVAVFEAIRPFGR
ncbi:TetR/AcrR family transcriptional regulator [Brachybacterium sp. p3-SID1565]|nr:TetR/AcrR family transcriptional regulator [Brachybacterium sp. p3-SID1565]MCT1385188.1 TetR/AcrR family transcriptional regulator [Brachybacterium sp. p3-SID1565]